MVVIFAACSTEPVDDAVAGMAITAEPVRDRLPEGMVYELRTYTAHPGKLDDLNKRFRDHTTRLFERHGMVNIGYWIPRDRDDSLVYIIAFPSLEAWESSWAAFRSDPEWLAARAASEEGGPIVLSVESVLMNPTDYSNMR